MPSRNRTCYEHCISPSKKKETDGATKQSNQEIEAYLAIFCANNPEQWSWLIPIMEFSYNQKSHATQTKSPFYLIMGSDPKAIPTAFPSTNVPEAEEWISNLQKAWDKVIAAHELARQKMMEWTTHKFKPFQKNNLVWLELKNLKLRYESKRLLPRTFPHLWGTWTPHVQTETSRTMEGSPHVPFLLLSKKTTSTDPITSTHHLILLMENLSMKLRQ